MNYELPVPGSYGPECQNQTWSTNVGVRQCENSTCDDFAGKTMC